MVSIDACRRIPSTISPSIKLAFIQAFGIKCREKSVLAKLTDFMQCEPTWDNLTQDKLLQFNQWIRASGGVKDSTACTYITLLKGVIRYGYIISYLLKFFHSVN